MWKYPSCRSFINLDTCIIRIRLPLKPAPITKAATTPFKHVFGTGMVTDYFITFLLGCCTEHIVGCRLSIGSTYNKNVFSDFVPQDHAGCLDQSSVQSFPPRSRPGGERYVHLLFTYLRCPYGQHSAYSIITYFPISSLIFFRFRHQTDRTFSL